VLAAGSVPPNPSEVLGSERMHGLIADLTKHATVIIDAPPLLPVTDGAVLTHQADGALIVVTLGKTTHDLLDKALDTLQKARGRALGIVLNKAPLRGVDASPYSYEYRRDYSVTTAAEVPVVPAAVDTESVGSVDDLVGDEVAAVSPAQPQRRGGRRA
jgi:Mrp family chromosome partitioning ATPase